MTPHEKEFLQIALALIAGFSFGRFYGGWIERWTYEMHGGTDNEEKAHDEG